MHFDNVRLLVHDFAASFHFWHEIMGLPLIFRDAGGETYAYFEAGGARLELLSAGYFAQSLGQDAPAPASMRGAVVFKVDDVDAKFAELVARGAAPLAEPKDRSEWFCRSAHLAAPDGYVVEIFKSLGGFPGNA
jgi:catechol 2,3-dioxygenase-like lactoylglutathione lyase family enzyme